MPLKIIKSFDVHSLSILDESGKVDKKLMPKLSKKEITTMYEFMNLSRIYDNKAIKLQRSGRMYTFAPAFGQEASIIGSSFALEKKDWMFPAFREVTAYFLRGMPIENIFLYWGGGEKGMQIPKDQNNFTISIPVGSQMLHAVGVGMAANIKKEKIGIITYFGDGATSEGDFHEAMNFAGVFNSPVVFICQNNQYAISLPRAGQTKSETLAQKAIAYGFKGIQVDGNDVFAVYKATKEALANARSGKGPTFIECFTYRMGNHTTADDALKYRSKKEVEKWKLKDPILRLKKYMKKKKLWTPDYEKKMIKKYEDLVNKAVEKYEAMPKQSKEDMFKFMYQEMPKNLQEQLEYLKEVGE